MAGKTKAERDQEAQAQAEQEAAAKAEQEQAEKDQAAADDAKGDGGAADQPTGTNYNTEPTNAKAEHTVDATQEGAEPGVDPQEVDLEEEAKAQQANVVMDGKNLAGGPSQADLNPAYAAPMDPQESGR